MDFDSFNVLSICAGGGGLDLAIRIAVPTARTVCYVEREAYACAVLAARMAEGCLDEGPIWTDIGTFDGRQWRGKVDSIIAGLPCQPYSVAGKRWGHADERAIWPSFLRVVDEVAPAVVFLENVPPFVHYFGPVADALERLGYRVEEPLLVAAEDVGAAHRRERFFALAHRTGGRRGELRESSGGDGQPDGRGEGLAEALRARRADAGQHGSGSPLQPARPVEYERAVANAGRSDWRGPGPLCEGRTITARAPDRPWRASEDVGHAERSGLAIAFAMRAAQERAETPSAGLADTGCESQRLQRRNTWPESAGTIVAVADASDSGQELAAVERSGVGLFAPGPNSPDWPAILASAPHLAPAVKPGLRLLVDGTPVVLDESRADQLRAGGNGVVPLQAALAFRLLVRRAGWRISRRNGARPEGGKL